MSSRDEPWWMRMSRAPGNTSGSRWDVRPENVMDADEKPELYRRSYNHPSPSHARRRVIDASPTFEPTDITHRNEPSEIHMRSRSVSPQLATRPHVIHDREVFHQSSRSGHEQNRDLTPQNQQPYRRKSFSTAAPHRRRYSPSPPIANKTAIARLAAAPPLQPKPRPIPKEKPMYRERPIKDIDFASNRPKLPHVIPRVTDKGGGTPDRYRPHPTSRLSQIISPPRPPQREASPESGKSIPRKKSALTKQSPAAQPAVLLPGAEDSRSSSSSAGSALFKRRGTLSQLENEEFEFKSAKSMPSPTRIPKKKKPPGSSPLSQHAEAVQESEGIRSDGERAADKSLDLQPATHAASQDSKPSSHEPRPSNKDRFVIQEASPVSSSVRIHDPVSQPQTREGQASIRRSSSEMDISDEAEVSSNEISTEDLTLADSALYGILCKKCAAWLPILSRMSSLQNESKQAEKILDKLEEHEDASEVGSSWGMTDGIGSSSGDVPSSRTIVSDGDEPGWVKTLRECGDLLEQTIQKAASAGGDTELSAMSFLCQRWMESELNIMTYLYPGRLHSSGIEKVVLPCGLVLNYHRNVFENSTRPRIAESQDSDESRKFLYGFLDEMGECNWDMEEDSVTWEVFVLDDLINLHGVFTVFDDSPRDVIFNYICNNIAHHLAKFDNDAPVRNQRDTLRKEFKEWLIRTNNELDDIDHALRFGCLPLRAIIAQRQKDRVLQIGPSGQWPWSMPGMQYVNSAGKLDKLLLEGQWFQLGLKSALYRLDHRSPLVLTPPQVLSNDHMTRIVPYHPPTFISRQDVLNRPNRHILTWPRGAKTSRKIVASDGNGPVVKEQLDHEEEDHDDGVDEKMIATFLSKSAMTSVTSEHVRSVVGPGVGWQKTALVESGVERLVDQCQYRGVDAKGREIWQRGRFELEGGSLRRQFRNQEEEQTNDSTVWSFQELLVFAAFVHTHGYMPRKLIPLLASSTDHISGASNRSKTPQQCTLLYSVIKCWITAAPTNDFEAVFVNSFLNPLLAWVNRWCTTIVGLLHSDSATLEQIIDFKVNNPHLIPALRSVEGDENPALDIAESGGPVDPPNPLPPFNTTKATTIVSAKSSVILPPDIETILVHSGNEMSVMDRTGRLPIEPIKLVNKIRHQITKSQFGEEDLKAKVATHTLRHPEFLEDLHRHIETHSGSQTKPADTLLELFLAKTKTPPLEEVKREITAPQSQPITAKASPTMPNPFESSPTYRIQTPPLLANWRSSEAAKPDNVRPTAQLTSDQLGVPYNSIPPALMYPATQMRHNQLPSGVPPPLLQSRAPPSSTTEHQSSDTKFGPAQTQNVARPPSLQEFLTDYPPSAQRTSPSLTAQNRTSTMVNPVQANVGQNNTDTLINASNLILDDKNNQKLDK